MPKRRRLKKIIIPTSILLVLAGMAFLIIHNLNSPAQGIVSQTPPATADIVDPYTKPVKYDGQYISYTYPAHYKPEPSKLTGNIIEVENFYGTKDVSKQISVSVVHGSLDDNSGLAYRGEHPELYKEETSPNGTVTFTGTDGHERTSFIQHGDLVVSISLSSGNLDDLTSDSQTVVNSLQWKQ